MRKFILDWNEFFFVLFVGTHCFGCLVKKLLPHVELIYDLASERLIDERKVFLVSRALRGKCVGHLSSVTSFCVFFYGILGIMICSLRVLLRVYTVLSGLHSE